MTLPPSMAAKFGGGPPGIAGNFAGPGGGPPGAPPGGGGPPKRGGPPKGSGLEWYGDDVLNAVQEATRQAIDETLGLCVEDAQKNVPVLTGTLRSSIKMTPAKKGYRSEDIEGSFGSYDVNYALAIETGNPSLVAPSGAGTRERLPWTSAAKNQGNTHFLRNAADKEYPRLAGRIKKRLLN